MALHNDRGAHGEELATRHLQAAGYTIRERNWRFRKEEVDIIAEYGDFLVFVEVKTRSTEDFGHPEEAVSLTKQKHLIEAAHEYIVRHDLDLEARFDIIAVVLQTNPPKINHIEEAFQPEW